MTVLSSDQVSMLTQAMQAISGSSTTNTFLNILPSRVAAKRAELIDIIWSGNGYPVAGADSIESDVTDPLTSSASNLLRVDKLTIDMYDDNEVAFDPSCTPRIWYPTAETANGKLALMHYGHNGSAPSPDENWNIDPSYRLTINMLIEAGYTVCGIQMSGSGASHNQFPDPTETLHYMKFLLEPVTRVLNEYAASFDAVYMTGKSGGGWTIALMAALDTRIKRSVSVAGSFPLSTAVAGRDWEQLLPDINNHLIDYPDLYMMAVDDGRVQVQLHNTEDSCCFTLAQYQSGIDYAPVLTSLASSFGGTWSMVWDDNDAHTINEYGRGVILDTFDTP